MWLSNKLLGQGYVKERLNSSLRKFYGRYGDLTKQYEIPSLSNFWQLLIWTLWPNLTFYLIMRGFHRTFATGAGWQHRTLAPPHSWPCSILGLTCSNVETNLSWTCLVAGLLGFEHLSVLLFCFMLFLAGRKSQRKWNYSLGEYGTWHEEILNRIWMLSKANRIQKPKMCIVRFEGI